MADWRGIFRRWRGARFWWRGRFRRWRASRCGFNQDRSGTIVNKQVASPEYNPGTRIKRLKVYNEDGDAPYHPPGGKVLAAPKISEKYQLKSSNTKIPFPPKQSFHISPMFKMS